MGNGGATRPVPFHGAASAIAPPAARPCPLRPLGPLRPLPWGEERGSAPPWLPVSPDCPGPCSAGCRASTSPPAPGTAAGAPGRAGQRGVRGAGTGASAPSCCLGRDFSNGYLVAEILARYFPAEIRSRACGTGSSLPTKLSNWARLQRVRAPRCNALWTPSPPPKILMGSLGLLNEA